MSRRSLLALFGFPVGATAAVECAPPLWSSTCGKIDGQCPVCGLQADPLRRPRHEDPRYLTFERAKWLQICDRCNACYARNV